MKKLSSILTLMLAVSPALAGSLEPGGAPSDSGTWMPSLDQIHDRLLYGSNPAPVSVQSPAEAPMPDSAPTLTDLMLSAPSSHTDAATADQVREGMVYWSLNSMEWGTRTGSVPSRAVVPTSAEVLAGYYGATNLTEVDPDLAASNFVSGVVVFGVTGAIPPRVLDPALTAADYGYYAATNLVQVEADLAATNLRLGVVLFGVTGNMAVASFTTARIFRTGQTNVFITNDDGTYRAGVAWPSNRFVVGTGDATNCVLDRLTGLMWAKKVDALWYADWTNAIIRCEEMDGVDGRGGYTDWRLPNVLEMLSLMDYSTNKPTLPKDSPFSPRYPTLRYWTSTTVLGDSVYAWIVRSDEGLNLEFIKTQPNYYYWPVRGGL